MNVEIGNVATQLISGNICFEFSVQCLCIVRSKMVLPSFVPTLYKMIHGGSQTEALNTEHKTFNSQTSSRIEPIIPEPLISEPLIRFNL
jgi:hypothetical protein